MRYTIALSVVAAVSSFVYAEPAQPLETLARLPIREVTIFKDGHAFVLHQGKMPTDKEGNVLMDYLPSPVLGTFFPASSDPLAKLSAVTASTRKVLIAHTALSLRELIDANNGAEVAITELPAGGGDRAVPLIYTATLLGIPAQSGEEQEANLPPNSGERLPVKGGVVRVKVVDGVKVVNLDRIVDITFKGPDSKARLAEEQFRNLLKLKLEWPEGKRQPEADVGLAYLQNGLRWQPSYRLAIDGKGKAVAELEATVVNDLADLEDVSANLVIGVPSFRFKGQVDPIALRQIAIETARADSSVQLGHVLSNGIMSQVQMPAAALQPAMMPEPMPAPGPEVTDGQRNEDLFVFPLKHLTLKKGQRMVVPVTKCDLQYRDVYTVDIPYIPPMELSRQIDVQRQMELAKQIAVPKVWHKLRMKNDGTSPFTTAPALIVKDGRALAQAQMTYTSVGGDVDLELTQAVEVQVKKMDREIARVPNAVTWQDNTFTRVNLEGKLAITSYAPIPIELEVKRNVLGNITQAGQDGVVEMVNVLEDPDISPGDVQPYWWGWFNWPWWWGHFNGVGRVTWKQTVESRKPVELTYAWNYYWQ